MPNNKQRSKFYGPILILVIGIVFLGVSFFFKAKVKKFLDKGEKTIATITDIQSDSYYDRREKRHKTKYTVYVQYYVNDISYETELGSHSSSMEIGDEIEIYYMPNCPNQICQVDTTTFVSTMTLILGCVFLPVGIISTIVVLVRSKSNQANLT